MFASVTECFNYRHVFRVLFLYRRCKVPDGRECAAACSKIKFTSGVRMDSTESNHPWFAVQVRPRFEKVVAHVLENKGFEHLLPLYSVSRQRSDRTVGLQLPLFPGYLFCRLDL